jgi:hypothetical protein
MRSILACVLTVTLSAAGAWALDDAAVVAEAIQTYEQIEAIRAEMRDAVGELSDEKRAYELALYELDGKPKTKAQLDELAGSIRQQTKSLERIQANNGSKKSLAYCKRRIRDLTLILQASQLTTDAQRAAHRQKLQPRIDELAAQIRSIQAPYEERIQEIQHPADAGNDALTAVIRPHIKTPESAYPGSTAEHLNATVHMAFASCNWNDRDGNQIAWAHIRIRPLDEIEDYHRENLLDGKYPIQSLSDGSIWVWAGHFLVTFVVDDDGLKGKENIQEAIQQFIDLQGLAAIQTGTEQVAAGTLAQ